MGTQQQSGGLQMMGAGVLQGLQQHQRIVGAVLVEIHFGRDKRHRLAQACLARRGLACLLQGLVAPGEFPLLVCRTCSGQSGKHPALWYVAACHQLAEFFLGIAIAAFQHIQPARFKQLVIAPLGAQVAPGAKAFGPATYPGKGPNQQVGGKEKHQQQQNRQCERKLDAPGLRHNDHVAAVVA